MPKIKTLKILKKKVKITANGHIKRGKSHSNHLMGKRRNVARKRSKKRIVESVKLSPVGKLVRAFNIRN